MARSRQTDRADQPSAEIGRQSILIIKLGAFGNIILSLGAFAAIRQYHAAARISVLTSRAYAEWLRAFPYFDSVLVDPRPSWWDWPTAQKLGRMLRAERFSRVYDLQTSTRSSRYFQLFPARDRPEWSGIAIGCSHPDRNPQRNGLHDALRQQGQLRQAGINEFPPADLLWCRGNIQRFGVPADFALLVPGSSPKRLAKRWPAENFQALAERLAAQGTAAVILGGDAERELATAIPTGVNLIGQTSFGDLADLARAARFAVGNDTGPMHLIAAAGCPTITLFSNDSDPARCAPSGRWTRILQRPLLADLPVDAVVKELPD